MNEKILEMYFSRKMKQIDIAKELNVSKYKVSRVVTKIQDIKKKKKIGRKKTNINTMKKQNNIFRKIEKIRKILWDMLN